MSSDWPADTEIRSASILGTPLVVILFTGGILWNAEDGHQIICDQYILITNGFTLNYVLLGM
jgi:hypothetical protein